MRKKGDKEKGPAQSRGERLKKLRQARDISIEEAHRKTKIHPGILEALEEDGVSNMSPAYVKGLLKIYCGFLGVDYREFTEEQAKAQSPAEAGLSEPSNIRPPIQRARRGLDLSSLRKKLKLKPLIITVCILAFAAAAFKLGKTISAYRASRPKKAATKPVAPKQEPQPSSVKPVAGKPELGVRAKEDCWLEVRTDGKAVFRNVLKRGSYEKWEAKERIEFSVGNAGGVDVEVNGKLLPPLGRRGQVIKNIVITREGLTVPQ